MKQYLEKINMLYIEVYNMFKNQNLCRYEVCISKQRLVSKFVPRKREKNNIERMKERRKRIKRDEEENDENMKKVVARSDCKRSTPKKTFEPKFFLSCCCCC